MAKSRSVSKSRKRSPGKRIGQSARRARRKRRIRIAKIARFLVSRTAPFRTARAAIVACIALGLFAAANLIYQVARKPAELFFPVSGVLAKSPAETWRSYGSLFERYSTSAVSATLLAALAQAEGSGDPVAHTYWRWRFSWHPFSIYGPASSAVGMYQITDGAFADARPYCIRDHRVAEPASCWFTSFYTRVLPNHAIELTAVYLDRNVSQILARHGGTANSQQKQDVAALVHLCGSGPASAYAARGFRSAEGERCGDHDAAAYLKRVNAMKRNFARLADQP